MIDLTRTEDEALLQGRARFVADLRFPGSLEAAFVRSPYAHAKILNCRLDQARAAPGVSRILLAGDLPSGARRLPSTARVSTISMLTDSILAESETRYVGEPVAVVLARDRYLAEDAADLVEIDYEPLSVCAALESALLPTVPLVHPELGSNLVGERSWEIGDVDAAFAHGEYIIHEQFKVHRGTSSPLEPRGLIAVPVNQQREGYLLEIWASTQSPYRLRDSLAELLGEPADRICVRSGSVGGGFGPKSGFYPEDFIIPWLALKTGVPVRWLEDRREHLMCARQERDQIHDVSVAFSKVGKIQGLQDEFVHDVGAYSTTVIIPWTTAYTLPGPYKIDNLRVRLRLAFTHKVPTMTVRGAGRPEAVFIMERVIDRIAQTLSMDPVEVRRRNFVSAGDLPWDTGLTSREGEKIVYQDVDAPQALQKVIESIGYEQRRSEFTRTNKNAQKRRGVGVASYIISTGRGPFEIARVRIESSGQVVVHTGTAPQGQGHHTVLGQICATELGIPFKSVTVLSGDTTLISEGFGTFASRSAVTAGNAVAMASRLMIEKLKANAAALFQCQPSAIQWEHGCLVAGKDRRWGFNDLITLFNRHSGETGDASPFPLESTARFETAGHTFSAGAHGAVVEVDMKTGNVQLLQYVAAHEAGFVINPVIVTGQIIGGVAHGVGNSLLERMVYDEEGQVLSSTFRDYLLPISTDLSPIEVLLIESPSKNNPLGIKGVGESGAVGVPAAIISAVENALYDLGVKINAFPMSPENLMQRMNEAFDRGNQSIGR